MNKLVFFSLKIPNGTNYQIENTLSFLNGLSSLSYTSKFMRILGFKPSKISLETVIIKNNIIFLVTCSQDIKGFVYEQVKISYPNIIISEVEDPFKDTDLYIEELKLANNHYYPILTYDKIPDINILNNLDFISSDTDTNDIKIIQISLIPCKPQWQVDGITYADFMMKNSSGLFKPLLERDIINDKVLYSGFSVSIRLASNSNESLKNIFVGIHQLDRDNSNSFIRKNKSVFNFNNNPLKNLLDRKVNNNEILNTKEIATLWNLK